MINITLNKIKEAEPCTSGWRNVLRAHEELGMDTEFPLLSVLDSNGLYDTIWCMRCLPEYESMWRKYGVWCAAQVEHLMTDERSKNALRVAWRHSDGLATDEELSTVWAAAVAAENAWAAAEAAAAEAAAAEAAAAEAAAAGAATVGSATVGSATVGAAMAAQQKKLVEILTAGQWVGGAPWDVENG